MPSEWVVLQDRRLALVRERTELGLKVWLPKTPEGEWHIARVADVRPFDPNDYPVQISGSKRAKMKAAGITPKDEEEKVCNKCFTLKPMECFAKNQNRKDGSPIRRPTCADCREGIDGVNKGKHKDLLPEIGTWWTCPICMKPGLAGVTVKCVVDHDHLTGEPREPICDSCNTGLGRFRNGKDFLENAINYLRRHGAVV